MVINVHYNDLIALTLSDTSKESRAETRTVFKDFLSADCRTLNVGKEDYWVSDQGSRAAKEQTLIVSAISAVSEDI